MLWGTRFTGEGIGFFPEFKGGHRFFPLSLGGKIFFPDLGVGIGNFRDASRNASVIEMHHPFNFNSRMLKRCLNHF